MREHKQNSHWHRSWFEQAYTRVYAHRDPQEAGRALAALAKHAELRPGPGENRVLDLGCGAGRYSRELAAMGFRVLALDYSLFLLRQAQQEIQDLPDESKPPVYLRGDFHRLPLCGPFDWVLSLFTSFGYSENDTDNEAMLAAMADLLAPGGRLLIDFLNPSALRTGLLAHSRKTTAELEIEEFRSLREDLNMVEKRILFRPRDAKVDVAGGEALERVKLYDPGWFKQRLSGLKLLLHLGDLNGGEWTPESPRSILVFQKETEEC